MMSIEYYCEQIVQRATAGQRPGAALANLVNAVREDERNRFLRGSVSDVEEQSIREDQTAQIVKRFRAMAPWAELSAERVAQIIEQEFLP